MHQGRPPIHGLYSKYKGNLVGDRVRELLSEDELLDLKRPVALIEALTQRLLEQAEDSGIINAKTRCALVKLAEEQSKAMERYYRVTQGTKMTHEIIGPLVIQRNGKSS
jgi:hypothetical protein